MYLKKSQQDFMNKRIENIENMIGEMKVLDKRYIKTRDKEIKELYDEKYSYLKIYLEDMKNTINE